MKKELWAAFFILFLLILLAGCVKQAKMTPLGQAIARHDNRLVQDLLNKGADANEAVDCAGLSDLVFYSPVLICAAGYGNNDAIKLLLDKGVDINIKSAGGWTALSYAAYQGKSKTAQFLLEKGADVDIAKALLESYAAKYPNPSNFPNVDYKLALKLLDKYSGKTQQNLAADAPSAKTEDVVSTSLVKSDIDELPQLKAKPNNNAHAIVIGIEHYRQKLPKADYAVQDAKLVAGYLTGAMGYSEENVILLVNDHASNVDLAKYFEKWLPNNVEKNGTIFIYYSGHGAPDPKTGGAYLVPYDGDPAFIAETGYSLKRLYEALGKIPAKEIVVVLDSCFSGAGGRSVLAEGARPLVMNRQSHPALSGNITVLTASAGEQISSTYKEKGHGLLTCFLLKGIKNEDVVWPDGSLKLADLFGYIKPRVERIARKQYNNEQTPQLMVPKKDR